MDKKYVDLFFKQKTNLSKFVATFFQLCYLQGLNLIFLIINAMGFTITLNSLLTTKNKNREPLLAKKKISIKTLKIYRRKGRHKRESKELCLFAKKTKHTKLFLTLPNILCIDMKMGKIFLPRFCHLCM